MIIDIIIKMKSLSKCKIENYKSKTNRKQLRNIINLKCKQHYTI